MALELFKLFGTIAVNTKDAEGDLDRVHTKASQAEQGLTKTGRAGGVAGTAMKVGMAAAATGVLALAGGIALSVQKAAQFEHAIDAVGAVSNATNDELKGLSDTAIRIGKDTAFSALETAQAMEILAANGLTAEQIMNGAADATVALAAAGGTTLAQAADTASTAMAVWNLKAEDMTDVVNRLAGAANVSRFGVEDMSAAVAQGGGAAASAGIDFADFSTTIAAMAPYFNSGSDAGTSFKTFLNSLTPVADKQKEAMRELGLITADGANQFFTASGEIKSMAEIAGLLNTATKDLTEQQKAQALETIFGSDAMRAAAAISLITEDQFRSMSDTMKNTDAAEVARQRMGNLKGAMDELTGSIEVIQIRIGSLLLPLLASLASSIATVLSTLLTFGETLVARFGAPLEYILGLLGQGLLIAAIVGLGAAIGALLVVIVPIVAPFVAIGVALAALGAIAQRFLPPFSELQRLFMLGFNGGQIGGEFNAISRAAFNLGQIFRNDVIPFINAVAEGFRLFLLAFNGGTVGGEIGQVQQAFFNFGVSVREMWLNEVQPALKALWEFIKLVVSEIKVNWDLLGPIFLFIANYIKTQIEGVIQTIRGIVQVISGVIQLVRAIIDGDWAAAWDALKLIAEGAMNIFIGTLKRLFGSIPDIIFGFMIDVAHAAGQLGQKIVDKIMEFVNSIPDKVRGALSGLPGIISNALINATPAGGVAGFVGGLLGRQHGGPTYANTAYIVGEAGPEIFVPRTDGYVMDNESSMDALGSGSGVSVFIDKVYARDEQEAHTAAYDMGWALKQRGFQYG